MLGIMPQFESVPLYLDGFVVTFEMPMKANQFREFRYDYEIEGIHVPSLIFFIPAAE
jgi:hypothetical protein